MREGLTNIILLGDTYKVGHHLLYPPATTALHSYFESRGGKFERTVFFGLQYILKKWLEGVVLTQEMIDEAAVMFQAHIMGAPTVFNRMGAYSPGARWAAASAHQGRARGHGTAHQERALHRGKH